MADDAVVAGGRAVVLDLDDDVEVGAVGGDEDEPAVRRATVAGTERQRQLAVEAR